MPPTYRPNAEAEVALVASASGGQVRMMVGTSGHLAPGDGETRATCPKCGSPYLAAIPSSDPRYGPALPGFSCSAGDCGYVGSARRA